MIPTYTTGSTSSGATVTVTWHWAPPTPPSPPPAGVREPRRPLQPLSPLSAALDAGLLFPPEPNYIVESATAAEPSSSPRSGSLRIENPHP